MAKRKNKRRVKRDKRVPLIATAGLLAGLSTVNRNAGIQQLTSASNVTEVEAGLKNIGRELVVGATGWDFVGNNWNFPRLLEFYGPMVVGSIGSKVATKLGVNRRLKNLPIVGKYIKL